MENKNSLDILYNGILDKSYVIEWENYSNSLLLTDGDEARHIHLDLHKRIDL